MPYEKQPVPDPHAPPGVDPKGMGTPTLDIEDMEQRFSSAERYFAEQHRIMREDRRMYSGEHWDDEVLEERAAANMPAITVNELGRYVDYQQGRMDADEMMPVILERDIPGDSTNPKPLSGFRGTAGGDLRTKVQVLEGMLRHVFFDSKFKVQRTKCTKHLLASGLSFFRVHEAESPTGKVLRVRCEPDPMQVYIDPYFEEEDGSDIGWAAVGKWLSKKEAERRYPKVAKGDISSHIAFGLFGDSAPIWVDHDQKMRVIEYMQMFRAKQMRVTLSDGRQMLEKDHMAVRDELEAAGIGVTRTDEVRADEVWMWTLVGRKIVKGPVKLPYPFIPIIPVFGKKKWHAGQEIWHSIIRDAEGPQKALNYLQTSIVQQAQMAAATPWIGDPRAFEGFEEEWENMENSAKRIAPFNEVTPDQIRLSPPQRPDPKVVDPAVTTSLGALTSRMAAIIGMDEAAFGFSSNATSARSTEARIEAQQYAVSAYREGLVRAVESIARLLLGAIPKVYTGDRWVKVRMGDGTEELVQVNANQQLDEDTNSWYFADDITSPFEMDVKVMAVAGDQTRKQTIVNLVNEMTKGDPATRAKYFDIVARYLDTPIAEELQRRSLADLNPAMMSARERNQWVDMQVEGHKAQLAAQLEIAMANAQAAQMRQAAGLPEEQPGPEEQRAMADAQRAQAQAQKAGMDAQTAQVKNQSEQGQAQMRQFRSMMGLETDKLKLRKAEMEAGKAAQDADRSMDDRIADAANVAALRAAELREPEDGDE